MRFLRWFASREDEAAEIASMFHTTSKINHL
jgi:hypothetical protein